MKDIVYIYISILQYYRIKWFNTFIYLFVRHVPLTVRSAVNATWRVRVKDNMFSEQSRGSNNGRSGRTADLDDLLGGGPLGGSFGDNGLGGGDDDFLSGLGGGGGFGGGGGKGKGWANQRGHPHHK